MGRDAENDSRTATAIAEEFAQLQREYRNMEQNRRAYTEESQSIIRRQQAALAKLRRDEDTLRAELAMEERHLAQRDAGAGASAQLAQVQDQGDQFAQRLAVEARNLEELNKAVRVTRARILQQRKSMGGVNAAKEGQRMVAKQVRILENRLEKALVRFNEALAENKRLRDSIDGLRRERVVFDNIYRKLERDLADRKAQMSAVIESSNQAYEARDRAQVLLAALEQQGARERADFERQAAELEAQMEAERRRKDQMLRERAGLPAMAPSGSSEALRRRGNLSVPEEAQLKHQLARGAWGAAKDKASAAAAEVRVQSYEDAFNRIKAATGIADVDALVTTFIAQEEKNFSLFNFVNEQNAELERLEEQLAALRAEEDKFAQESGADAQQHQQLLRDLTERVAHTEAAADKFEMRYADAARTMAALRTGIQSIFLKTECASTAMADLLSDSQVTEQNIMQFLGIVEQRTNEVLHMWAAFARRQQQQQQQQLRATEGDGAAPPSQLQLSSGAASHGDGFEAASPSSPFYSPPGSPQAPLLASILGQGPAAPSGRDAVQIQPPELGDYSSDDGSDNEAQDFRPLTHQELKVRTMKTIHKSAQQHQQQQQQQHHPRK